MAKGTKQVETLRHDEARRKNIPTAELQTFLDAEADARQFGPVSYTRARPLAEGETRARDEDRDPQLIWNGVRIRLTQEQVRQLAETGEVAIGDAQLVWRGKDTQDWSDLIVQAPPLYIQEKIHPKAIIDDLQRATARRADPEPMADLFADFNGVAPDARAEFYQHDAHWSNRMILGDSLQVMASLAERESLRGKVQCIYFDPPYGIKFNSNWQVSTESHDVKDGKREDISREPEQVKAFRDTWKDGIHSYLTYLRDRPLGHAAAGDPADLSPDRCGDLWPYVLRFVGPRVAQRVGRAIGICTAETGMAGVARRSRSPSGNRGRAGRQTRHPATGVAGKAFQAVGVAPPPNIRNAAPQASP